MTVFRFHTTIGQFDIHDCRDVKTANQSLCRVFTGDLDIKGIQRIQRVTGDVGYFELVEIVPLDAIG